MSNDLTIIRKGSITFEQLTDLVTDFVRSSTQSIEEESMIDLRWECNEHEIVCNFVVAKTKEQQAIYNAQCQQIAKSVIQDKSDLALDAQLGKQEAINLLTGEVMKALWHEKKILNSKLAFELVATLLDL